MGLDVIHSDLMAADDWEGVRDATLELVAHLRAHRPVATTAAAQPAPQPAEVVSDEEHVRRMAEFKRRHNAPPATDGRVHRSLAFDDMWDYAFNLGASRSSAAKDARIRELEAALSDERERCARVCEGMALDLMNRCASPHDKESHDKAIAHTEAARRIREEPAK